MINIKKIPLHVALIMDGNRRWAKKNNLPQLSGHKEGEERIEPIIDRAIELKIQYLTFWAFSTENWKRSEREVKFLLNLFRYNLNKKVDSFHKKNVKINIIGDLSKFPQDIQKHAFSWIEKTQRNRTITVNFALSYGGRDEIVRAINKWHETSNIKRQALKINQKDFSKYLDTQEQPDPDLLIRTGGEMRLSGFMLWQIAYTELYFTKVYWPDFTKEEFEKALDEYQKRRRRFGK